MKVIGILTLNFSLYHDLLEEAKMRGIDVATLEFNTEIPSRVGAIITSREEAEQIDFDNLALREDYASIESLLDNALLLLAEGGGGLRELLVGVDPGESPGIAFYGNGILLKKSLATTPDDVRWIIEGAMESYPAKRVVIRVGHGARLIRNRIINDLADLGRVEIVDEYGTSPRTGDVIEDRDTDAAASIALLPGIEVTSRYPLKTKPGEIRDLQRKSRIASGGRFTIPKKLAERVLRGELSLEEALALQGDEGAK